MKDALDETPPVPSPLYDQLSRETQLRLLQFTKALSELEDRPDDPESAEHAQSAACAALRAARTLARGS